MEDERGSVGYQSITGIPYKTNQLIQCCLCISYLPHPKNLLIIWPSVQISAFDLHYVQLDLYDCSHEYEKKKLSNLSINKHPNMNRTDNANIWTKSDAQHNNKGNNNSSTIKKARQTTWGQWRTTSQLATKANKKKLCHRTYVILKIPRLCNCYLGQYCSPTVRIPKHHISENIK